MTFIGETYTRGSPDADDFYCERCRMVMPVRVLESAAGFYLGTDCQCGPNSRESIYFHNRASAEKGLEDFRAGKDWMLR